MTSPSDLDLQEDVLAAARGDRDAFGRLVVATDDLVAAVLAASGGAAARAPTANRAAVAAVYLEAWDGLGRLGPPDGFLAWLRQAARRHAGRLAGPGGAGAPAEGDAPGLAALEALPADLREAVLLFALEGHSAVQVGRLLGLADGTVHERIDRARLLLGEVGSARLGAAAAALAPGGDLVAEVLARLPQRTPAEVAGPTGGFPTALTALMGMVGGIGAALLVLALAGVAWRACGPPAPAPPAAQAPPR